MSFWTSVFTGRVRHPCYLADILQVENNYDIIINSVLAKKHCRAVLFANTARGHGRYIGTHYPCSRAVSMGRVHELCGPATVHTARENGCSK